MVDETREEVEAEDERRRLVLDEARKEAEAEDERRRLVLDQAREEAEAEDEQRRLAAAEQAEEDAAKATARMEAAKRIGKGAAKAVGKGVTAVGKGAGKGVAAVGTRVGNVLNTKVEPVPWIFFFAALFIHFYDALPLSNSFPRDATHAVIIIAAYVIFTICYIFFETKTGFTTQSATYFGVSLFAFALPYILRISYVQGTYIPVILVASPIWALYIAMNSDPQSWLYRVARIWVFLIVIALAIIVLGSFTFPDTFTSRGVNVAQSFQRFWGDLTDSWSRLKEKLAAGGFFSWAQWQQKINATFNPYSIYYSGQVEQNQQEPTGVFITQLTSLYPTTYVGTYPVIMGRIEAKTFLDTPVRITPSCRLERPDKNLMGTPDPNPADPNAEPLVVNYQLVRDVTCTFPFTNLTPGSYYGVLGASFPYETWAYVTETFVSRQAIESYQKQGKDINQALGIDQTAQPIYTNGPVEVGISAADQPIDIDLASTTGKYIQQRFAFTISNRWSQGTVERVDSAVVMVPKPFVLRNCSPTGWSGTDDGGDYVNYTFSRTSGIQLDPRLDYSTVTCQLALPSKEAAQQVLAFGAKTPVTFVVIAKYTYTIESKVPIRVTQ